MIKFKNAIDKKLLLHLHPVLLCIVFDITHYLKETYDYDLVITSTLSDIKKDKLIGRKSKTHATGRAIDVRSRDMHDEMIIDLVSTFNKKYAQVAAISKRTGKPTLIVVEKNHLHIQAHKRFSLPEVLSIQSIADSF